ETPIPADLGLHIRQLWLLAVLNSRYQPAGIASLDAADVIIAIERYQGGEWLTAHTIFPRQNRPSHWIAEIGAQIFEFASAPDFAAHSLHADVSDTYLKVKKFY